MFTVRLSVCVCVWGDPAPPLPRWRGSVLTYSGLIWPWIGSDQDGAEIKYVEHLVQI